MTLEQRLRVYLHDYGTNGFNVFVFYCGTTLTARQLDRAATIWERIVEGKQA